MAPVAGPSNTASAGQYVSVAITADERAAAPGMIEIEFASGTQVRIPRAIEATTVSAAIAAAALGKRRR